MVGKASDSLHRLVGVVGILSYFVTNAIIESYGGTGEEFLNPASLLIGVPLAIVVANVCYTFGWITELAGTVL